MYETTKNILKDFRQDPKLTIIIVILSILLIFVAAPFLVKTVSNFSSERNDQASKVKLPTLNFSIHNENSNIKIDSLKLNDSFQLTDFIEFKIAEPDFRINKIEVGFPDSLFTEKINENSTYVRIPLLLEDDLIILPPDYKWKVQVLAELVKTYFGKKYLAKNEKSSLGSLHHGIEVPISTIINYTHSGEPYILKSIYKVNLDLILEYKNNGINKYGIIVNNIYLEKNLTNSKENLAIETDKIFAKIISENPI